MTEPGEAEVTTVIAQEEARSESHRADDLALRRQARLGLLGLAEAKEAPDPAGPP
jgi:hypothetical protein